MMHRSMIQGSSLALLLAFASLTGCMSTDAVDGGDTELTPAASGILSVAVAADQVSYALKQADGSYVQLNLDHAKQTTWEGSNEAINWRTAGGSPVDVFGTRLADGTIDVDAVQPAEGLVNESSALVTSGEKRVLALSVKFDGGPAIGSTQEITDTLNATAAHFAGSSFGKMKMTFDVAGPFNIKFGKCEDFYRWMSDATAQAQKAGFDTSKYQHLEIFGNINCGYGGLGQQPGNMTWIAGLWPEVVIHELGHNFGLFHAASRTCKSGSSTVTMSDSCTFSEYGDPFDPMGHGGNHHYNANYKINLGWIPSANVKTATSDGTITLAPMTKAGSGTQLLSVKGPKDVMYQVEFRQPVATDKFSTTDSAVNGVLVHAFFTQASDAGRAHLLDMIPGGNFNDAALGVGKSFSFFGTKAKMTVLSVSPAGAQVQISGLGGGTGTGTGTGDTSGSERVLASHSGKCLSIKGGGTEQGALAVQRACSGADDQAWKFESVGANTFTIKNVNSGKCLDVSHVSKTDGAQVWQWTCAGTANQKWELIDAGNGTSALRSVNSGKCLDVYGASTAEGAQYVQWACHNGANQSFRRQ